MRNAIMGLLAMMILGIGAARLLEGSPEASPGADQAMAEPRESTLVERLEAYSTHGEWVKYTGAAGDTVAGYVAFPEVADPAPAMIVIHEIFGMSDWIRTVVHDLSEAGYVALAPDLLTRRGGTEGADDARRAIRDLPADSITVDLDATLDYLRSLDAVDGESLGVIGFCWGGAQSFRYATNQAELDAVVVCYGSAPPAEAMATIDAPVRGIYGENDARINASLPEVEAGMEAAGKRFDPTIYPGAGHGFLRSRDVPEQADRAWQDILDFLQDELGGS